MNKALIEEYESRTHPCNYAFKRVTKGYPALYWFCGNETTTRSICCMGGDQAIVNSTYEQCKVKNNEL